MWNVKRRVIMTAIAATMACPLGFSAGTAHASSPWNDYQIVNVKSGKCLAPKGDANVVNTPIVQVTCNPNDIAQEMTNSTGFGALSRTDNYVTLLASGRPGRGWCIGGTGNQGSPVVLATNCMVFIVSGSAADAKIVTQSDGRCLAISGGSMSNNAPLIFWNCNGTTSQQWWNPNLL